ncbi:catechol 1,2-dioxygenase [Adhaeribacter soli]|uniref:catechol 1,2-dioxygenase n=1 Tax=Adhaeribacter soli TaxID=2607655 RepID=A0A5N1IJ11_9BACT|nr:catechol 1,2-dioxygenase [Adhaeribacter soli]KAA9325655.1 catechol 1,2-dioxygenase [Adhaeribacter soli]
MTRDQIDEFLKQIKKTEGQNGSDRVKEIVNRIVRDLFYTIEDLDVTEPEFWTAVNWLTETGMNNEFGLVAAGLGFEHFLDMRMDEAEAKAGITGGTPRTIEGPLYVAGAPVENGFARLDDGSETGGETLFMQGRVLTEEGMPINNALVEVWHANLKGNYSYFDKSQPPFHLRRGIRTGPDGKYQFQSIIPVGYSVPPNGSTDILLKALGRHGNRPAHIHFFISAPGYRKLTTQINIEGDPYLWDDFAFATRQGLVPHINRINDPEKIKEKGLDHSFASIDFDFTLHHENRDLPPTEIARVRAVG